MILNPCKNVTIKLVKKLNDDSFRCVNEVVIGAPYNVDKDLMDHFKVGKKLSPNASENFQNGDKSPYLVTLEMFWIVSKSEPGKNACESVKYEHLFYPF